MPDRISFELLGPLEVTKGGVALRVPGGRRGALLALLLINAEKVVSVDRLIDELWDGAPPGSAKTVQVHISHLRKLLGAGVIETHGHGYALRLGECELDTRRFEELVERARSEACAEAAETLREALRLWRGPALADFTYERFAQAEISRLQEMQLSAIESRVDADLALGRDVELVAELEALTQAHPFRERLRGALMLALYRSGRQADALASYQIARRSLRDGLGLVPSVELQELEQAILRQDPGLAGTSRVRQMADAERTPDNDLRTFLVAGMQSYARYIHEYGDDAGAQLAAQFAALVRELVPSLGGELLEIRGDEVVCVFGSPRRALRAAVGLQRELRSSSDLTGAFPLGVGIGVDAGEAVLSDGGYGGSALNLAANLCGVARSGQILASETVISLARRVEGIRFAAERPARVEGLEQAIRVINVVPEDPLPALPPPPWPATGRRGRRVLAASGVALLLVATGLLLWRLSQPAPVELLPGNSAGLLDAGTGRLSRLAPLGATPTGAASGFGAVWVSSAPADTVFRIDASSGDVLPIQVGAGVGATPAGIAAGEGAVWVADSGDGTVSEINPTVKHMVKPIPVGNGPTGVAITDHAVWVTNSLDGTVARIDPEEGQVERRVSVGVDPTAIAAGAGALWVTLESTDKVARIDPRATATPPALIPVGHGPNAIAFGLGSVWVANSLDGSVWRINPAPPLFTVEDQFPVGANPQAIAISRGAVWVANRGSATISRIDPQTRTVKTIGIGNDPTALTTTPRGVWAAAMPAASAHRGGTLRLVAIGPPDSIDPAVDYEFEGWDVLHMTNDGLVGFKQVAGPDGFTLVPDLAETLPTPTDDGKTYTFTLRRGIRYSDGTTVRPEDIRRAIERLFEGRSRALASYYTDIVGTRRCLPGTDGLLVERCDLSDGIETDDRTDTITFHLTTANPDFLDQLAIPPAAAVPATTPPPGQSQVPLPATGPYMISASTPSELVLTRNPHFHQWSHDAQPAGNPDRIVWRFGVTADGQVAAIEHDRADWMLDDIPSHRRFNEILTRYPAQVHINVSPETWYLFLNTRRPPFRSPLARRALNTAVDRGRIIQLVRAYTFAKPTCQLLPPSFPAYRRLPCPRFPDVERAKRMIARSGTSGEHVTFWTSTDPSEPALGRYFVNLLRKLGYHASLRIMNGDQYWPTVRDSKTRAQVGLAFWYADYPTPGEFFLPVLSCHSFIPHSAANENLAQYCNPAIDRVIARALHTQATNTTAAIRQWINVDRRITHEAPWVPLFNRRWTGFVSQRVGNYQYDPEWTVLIDQLWVR